MDTKKEIENYIKSKENNGALLITGKWGCGKSFLIKEIISDFNSKKSYAIAIVSLFGIDNVSSLNERVKEAYLELNSGFMGKTARGIYKILKKLAKESAAVTAAALPESVAASAISTGVSSVLSFNPLGFVTAKNTVGVGDKKRSFVLVFDDFERSNIQIKDLLGAINEYTENRLIKTVIIADEEKISKPEYSEFKEKLISRTVKLRTDYAAVIRSIVLNYSETEQGYVNFLKANLNLIQKIFEESNSENLRSLKSYLIDFERVFGAWKRSGVSNLLESKVFYAFGALTFALKSGEYKKDAYGFLFADTSLKKTYSDFQGSYMLDSLRSWIIDGIWNEDDFVDEIIKKFKITEMSDDEKLLAYGFWDLEQKNIINGLPIVVKKATEGELTRDELIGLLQKIFAFKKYSVPITVEIDYAKIYEGFKIRKNKILNGQISEPKRRKFSEKTQIEAEAYKLYDEIIAFDNKLVTYENRKLFVNYLNNHLTESQYSIKGIVIGVFDIQLMTLFLSTYDHADNAQKRDLAQVFLGLVFNDNIYTSAEERIETIETINKLKVELQNRNGILEDYITIAINNSFVEEIDNLLEELEKH